MAAPLPGTRLREMGYGDAQSLVEWRRACHDEAVMGTEALSAENLNRAWLSAYRSLYSNPRWCGQTIWHVVRHPNDLELAAKYVLRIIDNYLFHRTEHAHRS